MLIKFKTLIFIIFLHKVPLLFETFLRENWLKRRCSKNQNRKWILLGYTFLVTVSGKLCLRFFLVFTYSPKFESFRGPSRFWSPTALSIFLKLDILKEQDSSITLFVIFSGEDSLKTLLGEVNCWDSLRSATLVKCNNIICHVY